MTLLDPYRVLDLTDVRGQIAGMILARRLDKITTRDVYRAYNGLCGDVPGILRAMDTLDIAGWVTVEEPDRGKRPSHWTVNPGVHEKFGERAKLERQRRERVRAEIAEAHAFFGLAGEAEHEPL